MSAPKPGRRAKVRRWSRDGVSQAEMARRLGVSRRRIRQILVEAHPGDVLHERMLSMASAGQLHRHAAVLRERIARDRRYLQATLDEILSREIDAAAGLTLPGDGASASMRPCSRRQPPPPVRVPALAE